MAASHKARFRRATVRLCERPREMEAGAMRSVVTVRRANHNARSHPFIMPVIFIFGN